MVVQQSVQSFLGVAPFGAQHRLARAPSFVGFMSPEQDAARVLPSTCTA